MKIQPTNPANDISLKGKILTSRIIYNGDASRSFYTDYKLDNGKQLTILESQIEGQTVSKLHYLTNRAGKWIKSKLSLFSNNKVYKAIRSEAK